MTEIVTSIDDARKKSPAALARRRHNVLVSATLTDDVKRLAEGIMRVCVCVCVCVCV